MDTILAYFRRNLSFPFVLFALVFSQNYLQVLGQPDGLLDYGIEFPEGEYDVPEATDSIFSNGIVYIDPDWTGTESGTIDEPYNSWTDIEFSANVVHLSANTAYLQKRGTSFKATIDIVSREENVLIGAYKDGDKPIIQIKQLDLGGYHNIVRDMHIKNYLTIGTLIPSGSHSWVYNNNLDGSVHDADLLVVWTHHNKIIANYIHDGLYEGIFMKDKINGGVGNEVGYNYIVDVNKIWYPGATQQVADGDGIQVTTNDSLWIHHNVIDRSNTGNKFCIIINDEPQYYADRSIYALIEYNVLILPKTTDEGGSGIYLGAPHNSIVRYNRIYSKPNANNEYLLAMYASSRVIALKVYGNLIVNALKSIHVGADKVTAYNNTFINCGLSSEVYWTSYENNITTVSNSELSSSNIFTDAIDLDSLFVDAANNDYRLKEGSPAIDAGINTGYTVDINGDSVPANAVDVGAYEYGSSKSVSPPTITLTPTPVVNNKPIVDISYPLEIYKGMVSTIDASGSYDPDNDAISFSWTLPSEISATSLTSPSIDILPSPDIDDNEYTISLVVSDGQLSSSSSFEISMVDYNPSAEELKVISVIASDYQDNNYPENIIDGDPSTRWSAEGDNQWVELKLDNSASISHIELSSLNGDSRTSEFDIYTSIDHINWEPILQNTNTSGFSLFSQTYNVPEQKSSDIFQYVKVVGHMNSENDWNSYSEINVYGYKDAADQKELAIDKSEIVEVYPNPATFYFTIDLKEDSYVRILNIYGEIVLEQDFTAGQHEIASDLSSGNYILQFNYDNNIVSKQLTIL